MRTTETLRAEHEGVLAVLAQLERAASAVEQGQTIPPDLFSDIEEFFAVFVDRCHHAKEEQVLFPLLGERGEALADLLEEQHVAGRRLAGAYAGAVAAYQVSADAAPSLAGAARAYAEHLRTHIALETDKLFPLTDALPAGVDADAAAAFDRIEDEQLGPGTHERLHAMIDTLAPRIDAVLAPTVG